MEGAGGVGLESKETFGMMDWLPRSFAEVGWGLRVAVGRGGGAEGGYGALPGVGEVGGDGDLEAGTWWVGMGQTRLR